MMDWQTEVPPPSFVDMQRGDNSRGSRTALSGATRDTNLTLHWPKPWWHTTFCSPVSVPLFPRQPIQRQMSPLLHCSIVEAHLFEALHPNVEPIKGICHAILSPVHCAPVRGSLYKGRTKNAHSSVYTNLPSRTSPPTSPSSNCQPPYSPT